MKWWQWGLAILGGVALLGGGTVATVEIVKTLATALGGGKDYVAFSRLVFDAVTRALPQLSVKARMLITAHAAYESGWGTLNQSRAMSNNLFNLTAGSTWKGPTVGGTDKDAQGKTIGQVWRVYPSINDAIADYWAFLGRLYPQAQAVLKSPAPTVAAFAAALKSPRQYYALDQAQYTQQLGAVLAMVEQALQVSA